MSTLKGKQLTFSFKYQDEFMEIFSDYLLKNLHINRSDFIRQAILEKVARENSKKVKLNNNYERTINT